VTSITSVYDSRQLEPGRKAALVAASAPAWRSGRHAADRAIGPER